MNKSAIPQHILEDLRTQAIELISQSTALEAVNFDIDAWLARWLETEQPALGGNTPRDLLNILAGVEAVKRLMGSISSGSYQ